MKIHHPGDYATRRREAYPPITDQLDMIFHGGIDYWHKSIAEVKARFPKEGVI
jgi:hypothetical protein